MAIVTRYFGTSSAGAGDGTSWADRAALFTGGAWSTVITGFNFSGTDGLICLVGPGTYSITVALTSSLFTNTPTAANPLFFHGCDSSGGRLEPPSLGWVSCQPNWDSSSLPILETTTNIATSSLGSTHWRLIAFNISGRNGSALDSTSSWYDWCLFSNSTSNSSANSISNASRVTNCVFEMTGSSYASGVSIGNGGNARVVNVRINGNTSASSGNRNGITIFASTSTTASIFGCTCLSNPGAGVNTSGSGTINLEISKSVVVGNGTGIVIQSVNTSHSIRRTIVTGNSGYGITLGSLSNFFISGNRFRDNASGNIDTTNNYPQDLDNDTSSGTDSSEYTNSGSGDYRVKLGSSIYGKGYGVADESLSETCVASVG